MLKIENLHVEVEGREVLRGINLEIGPGQTCVLFGPNGSGKSTLLATIMGFGQFKVTQGRIMFQGKDITSMPIDERARMGIGMLLQRPPNVVGLKLGDLVKAASCEDMDVNRMAEDFRMKAFLDRDVNVGFSGGELKRSELLQLTAQNPRFLLLDEPESGVDMESIDLVGQKIHDLLYDTKQCGREKENESVSALIITHTGEVLKYIGADCAYIIRDGKIRCSGRPMDLLKEIKDKGYGECIACRMVKI